MRKVFARQRRRIAYRLGNTRILQMCFHTLYHWKATMKDHRMRDILHVTQMLGDRSIANALKYTQPANFQSDDCVCRGAKTLTEASQLIEAGFDYVIEIDGEQAV